MTEVQVTLPLTPLENELIIGFSLLVREQKFFFSFFHVSIHLQSLISFLLDESMEEEVVYPLTMEEEEVDTMRSWMEVGGFPA